MRAARLSVKRLSEMRDFIQRKTEAQAVVVALIVGILLFAITEFFESGIRELGTEEKVPEWQIYLGIILIAIASMAAYLFVKRGEIFGLPAMMPDPSASKGESLHIVPISNLTILKTIQEQLVPELFGEGASPANEEVYKSYENNPRRSIALYSDDEKRFVGFASIWPLDDAVAKDMMEGKITENQIKSEHILPDTRNADANFALIPAIGVLDYKSEQGPRRALKLMYAFRRFIQQEFFKDPNRSMTVLAVGFSPHGVKWCDGLQMESKTMIPYADGTSHPLYAKRITAGDVEHWFEKAMDAATAE
jgi:hypothetical protein